MDGIMILAAIAGGLVILGLLLKVAMLNARMQGMREAQPRLISGAYVRDNQMGCLGLLTIIVGVVFLGWLLYMSVVLAA